jgi:chromosome segregation ATPase
MTRQDTPMPTACLGAIDELVDLLKTEIENIERGNFQKIGELFQKKRELVARIESCVPKLKEELHPETKTARLLRERLATLRAILEEDIGIVERMAVAASDLADEIERIRKRHSLSGIYGAKGDKKADPLSPPARLDQSM